MTYPSAQPPLDPRAQAMQAVIGPRVFGLPGAGLVSKQALTGMDEGAALAGLAGEQKSDQLFRSELQRLKVQHAVQVVHGLRFPGTEHADIDHALVCGDRVLLVDSKFWAPGTYTWYGESIIANMGSNQQRIVRSNFTEATDRFAQLVAPARVASIILVHKSRDGDLALDNTYRGRNTQLVDASEGLDTALSWLLQGYPGITTGQIQPNLYPQWQYATMLKVLEQMPGSPWDQARAHREAQQAQLQQIYAMRRVKRAERIDKARSLTSAVLDAREASKTEKARRRRQRHQEEVLRMTHDHLNSKRGFWDQKKW